MELFHITWVTTGTWISERMLYYEIPLVPAFILNLQQRHEVCSYLNEKILAKKYKVLALNVLSTHVHLLLACEYAELAKTIGSLKGYSAYKLNGFSAGASLSSKEGLLSPSVHSGVNPAVHPAGIRRTFGISRGAGLSSGPKRYYDGTIRKIWARGYNVRYIREGKHLENTLDYIRSNHTKHHLPAIDLKLREAATISLKQLEDLDWF